MNIKFYDSNHEQAYYDLMKQVKSQDCYHSALAYLLTLDTVCREHWQNLYDPTADIILFDGLKQGWQTGTSVRTTLLAFNLWNTYVDDDAKRSTPDEIFCCQYAPYYFEAIKLRFSEYL